MFTKYFSESMEFDTDNIGKVAQNVESIKKDLEQNELQIRAERYENSNPTKARLQLFAFLSLFLLVIGMFGTFFLINKNSAALKYYRSIGDQIIYWVIIVFTFICILIFIVVYVGAIFYMKLRTVFGFLIYVEGDQSEETIKLIASQINNEFNSLLKNLNFSSDLHSSNLLRGYELEIELGYTENKLLIEVSGPSYQTLKMENYLWDLINQIQVYQDLEYYQNHIDKKLQSENEIPAENIKEIQETRDSLTEISWLMSKEKGMIINAEKFPRIWRDSKTLQMGKQIVLTFQIAAFLIAYMLTSIFIVFIPILIIIFELYYPKMKYGINKKRLQIRILKYQDTHYENLFYQIFLRELFKDLDFIHNSYRVYKSPTGIISEWPHFYPIEPLSTGVYLKSPLFTFNIYIPKNLYNQIFSEVENRIHSLNEVPSKKHAFKISRGGISASHGDMYEYHNNEKHDFTRARQKSKEFWWFTPFIIIMIMFITTMLLTIPVDRSIEIEDVGDDYFITNFNNSSENYRLGISSSERYGFYLSINSDNSSNLTLKYIITNNGKEIHSLDNDNLYGNEPYIFRFEAFIEKNDLVEILIISNGLVEIKIFNNITYPTKVFFLNPMFYSQIFILFGYAIRGQYHFFTNYFYIPKLYKEWSNTETFDTYKTKIPVWKLLMVLGSVSIFLSSMVILISESGVFTFIKFRWYEITNSTVPLFLFFYLSLVLLLFHYSINYSYTGKQKWVIFIYWSVIITIIQGILHPGFYDYINYVVGYFKS